ncbi:DNA polymerase III subunit delta' [Endozoicomonas numazuensis]|uniref:DNA polymerase III subunit delta' n=1 Tax=Endozoicomonas numazuensis TaxID=1137799 RepID=UPI00069083A3|nr:DNA polymerase III subunit delta' [Endozoicomonas numazuensis]
MKDWSILPWQNTQWEQMVHCQQSDNLAHAYLLKGVPGTGKLQFAKALAAYLLCLNPRGSGACGHCKECELLKAGTHPDFTLLEPDDPGRPIRIDSIRKLNDFAHKTAQQGGRRVIILSPAEAMNVNAANALLKCLEEPGDDTIFLLVSARSGDMLPTIRSRCQQLNFSTPVREVAEQWLSTQLDDPAMVNQLLDLTVNSPLEAKRFADQGLLEKREALADGLKGLFKGKVTPVELAKNWQSSDLALTLSWIIGWLDDAVKLGLNADASVLRNRDQLKMLEYISRKSDARALLQERDWLMSQRQSLLEGGNLNPQMLMEGTFCRSLDLVLA